MKGEWGYPKKKGAVAFKKYRLLFSLSRTRVLELPIGGVIAGLVFRHKYSVKPELSFL